MGAYRDHEPARVVLRPPGCGVRRPSGAMGHDGMATRRGKSQRHGVNLSPRKAVLPSTALHNAGATSQAPSNPQWLMESCDLPKDFFLYKDGPVGF